MTTTTAPKFTAGQSVEVLVHDFATPGFPEVWAAGTVIEVAVRDDRKFDVQVRTALGTYAPQVVGVRGGNRRIRSA